MHQTEKKSHTEGLPKSSHISIIVVSFNQEYQYHTDIPVSIYMFVGYLFYCDICTSGRSLVMIPYHTMEAVFEAGCYLQL